MSAVPPNFAASALQSTFAQRQMAPAHDAERNQRATADFQQARAADQRQSAVGMTEDSAEVDTEAEGSGSQGRAFSDEQAPLEVPDDTPGPASGEEGHLIDFSA
jgi:hypothetical protein